MKKNNIYKTIVSLSNVSYEIISAECGCKAGKGPKASCKHIGTFCYALVEFCKSGQIPDFLTSFKNGISHIPKRWRLYQLMSLILEEKAFLGEKSRQNILAKYNPIPSSLRQMNSVRLVENLRNDMHMLTCKFNPDCGLLQLLVPPVEIAPPDYEYTNSEVSSHCSEEIELSDGLYILPFIHRVFNKETLNVTYEE